MDKTERYRMENIQKVKLNGRDKIIFDAYEYNYEQKAYIFHGQYFAPVNTKPENLYLHLGKK